MPQPALRRPPARRPPALLGAPSQQLPPRAGTWGQHAAVCVAGGLAAYGAAPLLDRPGLAVPALALGALSGLGRGVHGMRAKARHAQADRLVEALAPGLGLRFPDRRAVTLRSWSRGWPGVPRRVDLRYAPGVDDTDPAWLTELTTAVERRLLADYDIDKHDRRNCRIRLRWVPPASEADPVPAVRIRAERTVTELLGPTATVTAVQWAATEPAELVGLDVRHEAGPKLAAAGYRHRVERVMSTMLPGRWRALWDLEGDRVRFEVRPSFPDNLWLPVTPAEQGHDVLSAYDDLELAYGVDEDGQAMVWRPARDPNIMLVGAPGSGKTVAAHTLLVQVTRHSWPVWVVDGKSIEFLGFQDWPNVQIVATSIEEQIAVIHRAWEVMEHRYQLITSGRAKESDFEPLLVFLDEFADFRGNLAAWYAEVKSTKTAGGAKADPSKPLVLSRVQSIARKGRTSRVHLVFCTQRPDAEYFGGDMRDNFRMRVSMGRLSPQGAMMMWESPVVGTSIPRGCRGRATAVNDDNRAVEIQVYRTPDPRKTAQGSDEDRLLQMLAPVDVRHERLLILPPESDTDLDGDGPRDPTYSDYAAAPWVLASSRPDLDPVAHRSRDHLGGAVSSSPMALFGLAGPPPAPRPAGPAPAAAAAFPHPDQPARPALQLVPDPDVGDDVEYDGYAPPTTCPAAHLNVGDLILVDETVDLWAVVDAEPEEDVTDPDYLAVSWRSDTDDSGALSLPPDLPVSVRRPLDDDQE